LVEVARNYVHIYPAKQYETWLGGDVLPIGMDYSYPREVWDQVGASVASYQLAMSFDSALRIISKAPDQADRVPRFERVLDEVEKKALDACMVLDR
jgi:hypothetical protein